MISNIIDAKSIDALSRLVDKAQNIAVTCHKSPDGDAVGSSLALAHLLYRMGKHAQVVTPDMVPKALGFLPGVHTVVVFTKAEQRAREAFERADLIFCLDFNRLHRIDKLGEFVGQCKAPRVLIDHHLDPENIFDVMVSVPEATSTCELVFRVFMQMGLLYLLDRYAAQCLYTGMMTDTGNFTYGNDSPEVYEIVASLMRRHPDRTWLYNNAMNTFSADSVRLQGYALSEKMELFPEYGAALLSLDRDELARFNYRRGDTEGLVNKPLAIPEVSWVVYFREEPDYVKVSCRSVGDFSVDDICKRYFNGGGHLNAAGGEFYGTLAQAVDVFHSILNDLKKENNDEEKQ